MTTHSTTMFTFLLTFDSLYALKDESYLRQHLEKQHTALHQATISYTVPITSLNTTNNHCFDRIHDPSKISIPKPKKSNPTSLPFLNHLFPIWTIFTECLLSNLHHKYPDIYILHQPSNILIRNQNRLASFPFPMLFTTLQAGPPKQSRRRPVLVRIIKLKHQPILWEIQLGWSICDNDLILGTRISAPYSFAIRQWGFLASEIWSVCATYSAYKQFLRYCSCGHDCLGSTWHRDCNLD